MLALLESITCLLPKGCLQPYDGEMACKNGKQNKTWCYIYHPTILHSACYMEHHRDAEAFLLLYVF